MESITFDGDMTEYFREPDGTWWYISYEGLSMFKDSQPELEAAYQGYRESHSEL